MAARAALPQVAQSSPAPSVRWMFVVMTVITAAIVAGIIAYFAEEAKPGYSFVSQIVRTSEAVAGAQKAAEKRMADNIRLYAEESARIEKWYAERRFVEVNTRELNRIYCQNTKNWQNLSEADKQRVRDYLKTNSALLIESDACP